MMDFRTLPLFTSNLLLSDFITLRQSQNQPQEKPKPKEIILILGYQVKKVRFIIKLSENCLNKPKKLPQFRSGETF